MSDIRQQLVSDDHSVYLSATRELPRLPRHEVVCILWEVAQSHSGRIQARIMNPLREFDPELANKLALQILGIDNSIFHADAIYSLWKTRCPLGIPIASKMLLEHCNATVRMSCANYLGTCGSREQIAILQQALSDHGADEQGREVCEVAEGSIAEIEERDRDQ